MGQPGSETRADSLDESMDMGALLAAEEAQLRSLRRGEVIEGVVVGRDRDQAIVNVSSKSEGIVPAGEMQSLGHNPIEKLHNGDKILVYVIHPETSEGQVLLSIDRARGETGWRNLQTFAESNENFEVEVNGFNKGGLLANYEGVNAFIPLSQVSNASHDPGGGSGLQEYVGRRIQVKVIELNRRRNRVILSERAAMQEWRNQQKDRLLTELQEGQIRTGRITSIRDFGVFVDIGGADGLVHLSELSWERDKSPQQQFKVGQEVDAYVLKVDPESKKIALSLRRAQTRQWDVLVSGYNVGQLVIGKATKVVAFGVFAQVEGQLEGLIHVSEVADRKINHPNEVIREGDVLPLKIVRIERDRHRLALSLRQARVDAEVRGYVFDNKGAVVLVPEYERDRLHEDGISVPPWQRGLTAEEEAAESPEAAPPAEATAEAAAVAASDSPEAPPVPEASTESTEAAGGATESAEAPAVEGDSETAAENAASPEAAAGEQPEEQPEATSSPAGLPA